MTYFATEYTIHFDDTMAYGSHHFLTAFKFQCASREAFLFGERVFDVPGVKTALDQVHLLTADAYARNLHPAKLGDRLAIFLSLEEWGRVSARFCYRVLGDQGQAICAGFQTLICADANTQLPIPLPTPLQEAMDRMREIEEAPAAESFRDRILAGGSKLESVFSEADRQLARTFLADRYPSPKVLASQVLAASEDTTELVDDEPIPDLEAWVFAGQAAFDGHLLSERVQASLQRSLTTHRELEQCTELAAKWIGGDAHALISGSPEQCNAAIQAEPSLSQVAIHMQNMLGAMLWQADGHQPGILMGHSFGEIAALGCAGCFDLRTGVHIVCMRVRALSENAPAKGGLLVAACDRSRAEIEAQLLGLTQLVVAGRNHASQTLMSGPIDQLNQLREFLQRQAISATMIPSPTSFHHPHLRLAATNWLKQLRTLQFEPTALPVYSPIGHRFMDGADDIAATLAGQLVRSFDLQGAVTETIRSGVTKFVDCGSTGTLARLIASSCSEAIDVCRVETEPSKRLIAESANPVRQADVRGGLESQPAAIEATTPKPSEPEVPRVAIVAHGCILPGGARSPEQLFAAIMEQRLGIVDQRQLDPHWSEDFYSEKLTPDRSTSPLTGRVDNGDITVPSGVDAKVFSEFTRTQKLLCIALAPCIASLEGADRIMCLLGATADGFEDQDEVISLRFAGIDPSDHNLQKQLQMELATCEDPHGAVQQVFDRLVRPGLEVMLVDAACASSLYTVALGMQALETGKADAVIAGGFFCPGPGNSCLFSQFRGTTSTGCRPFDAGADGVVFSEGAAIVTLRRVDDAKRLGLGIKATVLGAGLSSDGKSSSANVPQSRGQLLSLARCYDNHDIDPSSIMAIEGHGTSTPVGDSTELETLRQFFSSRTDKTIPVHSLKGLLGHAGWAAGTASVIAVCQYMERGIFPPQTMHHQPSAALKKAQGTLYVPTASISLPPQQRRIAIDGFGFGGANAHIVLEAYSEDASAQGLCSPSRRVKRKADSELVFVACHQEQATDVQAGITCFNRQTVKLPSGQLVLPELADDMDISQRLAVILAERVIAQIPQFDDQLRRETSFILAMNGKTERGIEATMRILTPRFRRLLAGNERALNQLNNTYENTRASGTYTLQCMMPNVASGRAALLLNLNGPNFVVDAGAKSLEAAFESAELLLNSGDEGGSKLVIVAGMQANSCLQPQNAVAHRQPEYAAAFGVTTRHFAEAKGLPIISSVNAALEPRSQFTQVATPALTPAERVKQLASALAPSARPALASTSTHSEVSSASSSEPVNSSVEESESVVDRAKQPASKNAERGIAKAADCQIHIPIWVESPLAPDRDRAEGKIAKSLLVIARTELERVDELLAVLPAYSEQYKIVLVGDTHAATTPVLAQQHVIHTNVNNEEVTASALDLVTEFDPDAILVLDNVSCWDRSQTLASLAFDNRLCEFLFLASQRQAKRLETASVELWGVLLNSWNGEPHPASGPITGLLKSIQREFPEARTGTICSRGLGVADALSCLCAERHQHGREQEVVFDQNTRFVRRLRPATTDSSASPQVDLTSESVVVASGGAKGVTAVMLDALLRDNLCTVIAIGRSPLEAGPDGFDAPGVETEYYARLLREHPHITAREMKSKFLSARSRWEAHRTIQELASIGGRVEYIVADITDPTRLESVFEDIVSRHGRIDLMLHGAGVQKSKRLGDRSLAEFRETFAVKIRGMHNLNHCCQKTLGHSVSSHILTSAYSIFGNDGQHDYGAANETLDRLCCLHDSTQQRDRWSSIAWLAWEGIGMTRGSEYAALAKNRKLSGVDRYLGQRLFREVMAGQLGSPINVPMSTSELREYGVRTIPAAAQCTYERGRVLESRIELSSIDCLPFHKIRNTPTLPGAWILELLVKAASQLAPSADHFTNLTIENTSFARFVRFAHNQEPNVRVVAEQTGNAIDVWMLVDVLHPSGVILSTDVVCASARILFGTDRVLSSIPGGFRENPVQPKRFVKDPYCDNHKEVALSGPFNCLSEIEINTANRRAKFTPTHSRQSSNTISALLLDAAWRVGAMYANAGRDDVFVPVKIGKLIFPQGMNHTAIDHVNWEILSTTPRPENRNVRWDRTEVFDQAGQLKLVVEDALAAQLL